MALIYCPECGKQVSDSAAACPNCGYPISSLNVSGKDTNSQDYSKPEDGKYNVFLNKALSDGVSATAQIVSDVCGYTYADALALCTNLPTVIVYNVTLVQAKAVANALADYGMDVAVYDKNGYVDFQDEYDSESYTTTSGGTSIANSLLAVLGTLTVANLINRVSMRRYAYPYPFDLQIPYVRRRRFMWNRPMHRPSFFESLVGRNLGYRHSNYGRYSFNPGRSNYRSPMNGGRMNGAGMGMNNQRPQGNMGSAGRPKQGGMSGGLFSGGIAGKGVMGGGNAGRTNQPSGRTGGTAPRGGSGFSGGSFSKSFGGKSGISFSGGISGGSRSSGHSGGFASGNRSSFGGGGHSGGFGGGSRGSFGGGGHSGGFGGGSRGGFGGGGHSGGFGGGHGGGHSGGGPGKR